jgi:hypothetical protein
VSLPAGNIWPDFLWGVVTDARILSGISTILLRNFKKGRSMHKWSIAAAARIETGYVRKDKILL